MEYDIHSNSKVATAFDTESITSNDTFDGEGIDVLGFRSIEFIVTPNDIGTGGVFTLNFQESPTDSNYTDISPELVLGNTFQWADATPSDDNATKRVGVISKEQFVRMQIVSTGVSGATTFTGTVLLSNPIDAPVADSV